MLNELEENVVEEESLVEAYEAIEEESVSEEDMINETLAKAKSSNVKNEVDDLFK